MTQIKQSSVQEKVYQYYKASTEDYLKYYQTAWHQHMHYGFQRDLAKGGNPTENLVRYMSKVAEIQKDNLVLDAGCGVGGSVFWLADNINCSGVGLNLMEMQLKLATTYRENKKNGDLVNFVNGDFMQPPFATDSFDVIWAIESADHAPDKKKWVQNMFELLKPDGRLIVADGFHTDKKNQKKI